MFSRAPLHFELGLEPEACTCPQQLVQFWLTVEIEGFIGTYVMTRKYNCVLFSSQARNFTVQSTNTADNPCTYIQPVLLTTGSRRTRTWRRFQAGSDSVMSKEIELKKEAKHQLQEMTNLRFMTISIFLLHLPHFKTFLCKNAYVSISYADSKNHAIRPWVV